MFCTRKSLVSLASAVILTSSAAIAQAAFRYVPSASYPTIQSAINSAVAGDVIAVAAGTYYENLTWVNKDLTITGAGAGKSIIDGNQIDRCFTTQNLTAASRLIGFTLQHGEQAGGGGLYNSGSSLLVMNCTFQDDYGGYGAGMFNDAGSNPTVLGCTFSGCTADYGAAIVNQNSSATLTNSTFNGNYAALGGALYTYLASSFNAAGCVFLNNIANGTGGGGVYVDDGGSATLTNCTFNKNYASQGYGGAVYTKGSLSVTNCIVWGNTATLNPGIYGSSRITYSDVQGAASSVPDASGNFAADPLFVNAAAGNFRLMSASPCRNRGNNNVIYTAPFQKIGSQIVDMDGNPRLSGTAIDMGAYEYQNIPPQASSQSITVAHNSYVHVSLYGSDPDGTTVTYSIALPPFHGTLKGSGTSWIYTPNPGYIGTDSFFFWVTDADGANGIGTVTIQVK